MKKKLKTISVHLIIGKTLFDAKKGQISGKFGKAYRRSRKEIFFSVIFSRARGFGFSFAKSPVVDFWELYLN
jgi:hypothetical protein